jgi:hypothetical protein
MCPLTYTKSSTGFEQLFQLLDVVLREGLDKFHAARLTFEGLAMRPFEKAYHMTREVQYFTALFMRDYLPV